MSQPLKVRSRVRPTWEGMFWFLLAAVLLTQGWYRNIGLLSFLAFFLFGLLVMQAVYIIWYRRDLSRVRAVRHLPESLFAGEPFLVELELENPGRRQLALRVEDWCEGGNLRWYVAALQRGSKLVLRQRAVLTRRGPQRWSGIRISTAFPLGLVRREVFIENPVERIVYPALGEVNLAHLERVLEAAPPCSAWAKPWHRPLPGAEFEFHGLREYRSGDSPRYVHWRSSARAGKLLVREMEPPITDHVLIVLDAWRPGAHGTSSEQTSDYSPLEDAISLTASVLVALNRDAGREVGVMVLDSSPRLALARSGTPHYWMLLASIALVQGHDAPPAWDWASQLPSHFAGAPTIWITSRPNTRATPAWPVPVALFANVHDPALRTWYQPPSTRTLLARQDNQDTLFIEQADATSERPRKQGAG